MRSIPDCRHNGAVSRLLGPRQLSPRFLSPFHWISRTYKDCEFYAIQNGFRANAKRLYYEGKDDAVERSVYFSPDVMSMPHFFCFGEYEADLYKRQKHNIDNFYPVGSLKGGFYKTCVSKNNTEIDFDICLVSQVISFPEGRMLTRIELGVKQLHELLNRYVREQHLSLCIASRHMEKESREKEKHYFFSIFADRATIIERTEENMFATYDAMDRSSVIVSLTSTAAFEAFGWGRKTLFCNLLGGDFYRTPLPEICAMDINDYALFKNKLDYLLKLDQTEYESMIGAQAKYLMNYDFKNPAHMVIREKVLKCLN